MERTLPRKRPLDQDRTADLLEKLLVFKLYSLGVPQDRIAKLVGRQKAWVNDLLKGLPKRGESNGGEAQAKKAKKRSRSR